MRKEIRITWLMVVLAAAALFVFGCSSKNTVDTNPTPTGASIDVAASPTSVATSETSVVEATLTVGSEAVVGQQVRFTVSPAGAGTVTPEYDTTGSDGVAATVFTAVQAGAVVVLAQVTGSDVSSSVGLSVSEGQTGGSGNVNVSVSRNLLVADGKDSSVVTVVVRDALGQVAPAGTLVKLVAGEKFVDKDANGYWSQNIDSLVFDANGNGFWDGIGMIPSTVTVAGAAGEATVDFVSGDAAGTVYIKATIDDGGITGFGEVSIQISPNAVMHSIFLASDSMTLAVEATGGMETGTLRAIGYDTHGNPVPQGMPIVFVILDGPGGGEHLDTLGDGPDTAYTNGQGEATTTISAGTISGTIRIRAYSGIVLSTATQVLICAGPPEHIVVGAEECNVPWLDRVGDSVAIVAMVADVYLNPVNDSTVVYFRCDEGTMKAAWKRLMTDNGKAVTYWYCGNNVPTADGIVWIYAETAGGTVLDSNFFYNSWVPATLNITGWATSILADGESNFSGWIDARDINGNYVYSGTQYSAESNYLTVYGGAFENGCYSSIDHFNVMSTTLKVDASLTGANDNGIGAVDTVTYWCGSGASVIRVCSLLTGNSYSGSSTINGSSSVIPGETVSLSAKIGDRWGNPLGDHTLNMTASGGVVTGGTQETDGYGEANGFIWTAPVTEGDYNIRVTDTDPRGGGMGLTLKITVKAAA